MYKNQKSHKMIKWCWNQLTNFLQIYCLPVNQCFKKKINNNCSLQQIRDSSKLFISPIIVQVVPFWWPGPSVLRLPIPWALLSIASRLKKEQTMEEVCLLLKLFQPSKWHASFLLTFHWRELATSGCKGGWEIQSLAGELLPGHQCITNLENSGICRQQPSVR